MTEVAAVHFDGQTSQSRAITLQFDAAAGTLAVAGADFSRSYPRAAVVIDPPLGRTSRFVHLPDGGRCEVADHAALEAALAGWRSAGGGAWLHRMERSWPLVLAATVLLVAFSWALIRYGLPWGAKRVAFALPAGLTRQLGQETLEAFDHGFFEPSALTASRRAELQRTFREFLAKAGDPTPYRIEFRKAPAFGANAFALPSGDIVITDDLVALAGDDAGLCGVLAHECGHVQHRHALRGVLQNSAVVVVVSLITGDVSSATAFGGAIPTYLMQSKFSREFEQEADDHAVAMLRAAGLDPAHFAALLEQLAAQRKDQFDSRIFDYLSSHPPTQERLRAIRAAAAPAGAHGR